MKTRINKIIASLIIMMLLVVTIPFSAFAVTNTEKEEVVYATLENNGTLKNMYVVNAFNVTQEGQMIDYGDYDSVVNLSNTEQIQLQDGKVTMPASEGRVYYQGNLSNRELPWIIAITYFLDGNEITAEQLAGKSGNLEIKLSFKQNPKVDAVFFENYTLQTTLTLEDDKAKDIEANGATIANVGNSKSLTYMVLAGGEKEYIIKANITDFTMEGIQINGIALALDIDTPDTSEFTNKLTTLQKAIKELNTGANSLNTGISKVNTGASSLKTGSEQLNKGADTVDSAVSQLSKGAKELTTGGQELKTGLEEIDSKSGTLEESSKQIKSGIDTMTNSVNKIKETIPSNASTQISTLSNASKSYLENLNALIASKPEGEEKETLKVLRDNYISIHTGVQQMTTITATCINATTQLSDSLNLLRKKYEAFDTGIDNYTLAVSKVAQGYQSLYQGITKVDNGMEVLKTGTLQLKRGSYELYKGSSELTSGTTELLSGSEQMQEGTQKMQHETQNVDTQINSTVEDIIKEYTKTDFEVKSFVSSDNTKVKAVQFVLQTEGISKPEEKQQEQTQEENLSFWDRFMNLFKK